MMEFHSEAHRLRLPFLWVYRRRVILKLSRKWNRGGPGEKGI